MKTNWILAALLPVTLAGGYLWGQKPQAPAAVVQEASLQVAGANTNAKKSVLPDTPPGKVHQVKPGMLIMDAVKAANPGDVIQVWPGDYIETVYIDKDSIRLSGVIIDGKRPRLFGEERLNDAICIPVITS